MVLDDEGSHSKPLINKHHQEKRLNLESDFSQKCFHSDLISSELNHERIRVNRVSVRSKSSSSTLAFSKRSLQFPLLQVQVLQLCRICLYTSDVRQQNIEKY